MEHAPGPSLFGYFFLCVFLHFATLYLLARLLQHEPRSDLTNCARLAQLVRSLTANQTVPGSIPGLVEG